MTIPRLLSDLDEVLHVRPALGTSSLHDQAPGMPQARDRALLAEEAAEHPAIGDDPAVGPISAAQAERDIDAAIGEARAVVSQRRYWIGGANIDGEDSCVVVETSKR